MSIQEIKNIIRTKLEKATVLKRSGWLIIMSQLESMEQ